MTGAFRFGRVSAPPGPFTRLDPRARLVTLACVLVAAAVVRSPLVLAALSAGCLALPRLLRLPPGATRSFLRLASLPLAFTVLAHFLYGPGSGWLPWPSPAGFGEGILHAMSFWISWCAFALFWSTTAPDDVLRAVRRRGTRAGRAVEDFWLTMELALRFTPVLAEEAERLVLAQTSRGAEWDGPPLARARRAAGLVVPLVHAALRRAEGLADTLVARGFGSGPATSASTWRFGIRDVLACAAAVATCAALVRWA